MSKNLSLILSALLSCAIFTAPLLAEERVEVGSRNNLETSLFSDEARLHLASLETTASISENATSNFSIKAEQTQSLFSYSLFNYEHPGTLHAITNIPSIDSFGLEDGSIWSVGADIQTMIEYDFWGNYTPYYLVTQGFSSYIWYPTDPIIVQPNHWSLGYSYWLTNKNTGVSIPANLQYGPLYNSIYKYTILWINYDTAQIELSDGSHWTMDNRTDIRKWLINDTVIIGGKDSWLMSSSPNVLINVSMLNYASGISSHY